MLLCMFRARNAQTRHKPHTLITDKISAHRRPLVLLRPHRHHFLPVLPLVLARRTGCRKLAQAVAFAVETSVNNRRGLGYMIGACRLVELQSTS